jgi:transcriptional regulator GlxA family with amidase domain
MPSRIVVVIVFDGVQPIDVAGPVQALATANEEGASPPYALHVCSFSPGKVTTNAGFCIEAEPIPPRGAIDTLMIPGGPGVHALLRDQPEHRNALRTLCKRAARVCSICTGAFLLAQVGILDGRHAVTHWRSSKRLASEFPFVLVDPDRIFVNDGNIWTSAGVTAGIDMTLALIEQDNNAALAISVARRLVVYVRRPGGQAQYSEPLALQTLGVKPYENLLKQIAENPVHPWTIDEMASVAGQSIRTFHRQFKSSTGQTPSRIVEHIRAELARLYLHTTKMGLKQIATKAGFESESALRHAMQRQFGISPKELRERFG